MPRAPLVEAKTSKIVGISSGEIPSPLSFTTTRATPVDSSHRVDTCTFASGRPSAASIALVTMFSTARWMPSSSMATAGRPTQGRHSRSTPNSPARDRISSTASSTVAFRSAGSRAGSRSLEKESMSSTKL